MNLFIQANKNNILCTATFFIQDCKKNLFNYNIDRTKK